VLIEYELFQQYSRCLNNNTTLPKITSGFIAVNQLLLFSSGRDENIGTMPVLMYISVDADDCESG
jgi:hypothetical protein